MSYKTSYAWAGFLPQNRVKCRRDIRESVLTSSMLIGNEMTAQQWFNTAAFQMPAPFTFGSAGRNVVEAAGESNVDFALIKDSTIREGTRLQFRAEVFNLFNHTNFADVPGRTASTASFGQYTSAENPRQIQVALKFLF